MTDTTQTTPPSSVAQQIYVALYNAGMVFFLFLLVGCGGGGGVTPPATTATSTRLSVTVGIKHLEFNWTEALDVGFYRLMAASGDGSDFQEVARTAENSAAITHRTVWVSIHRLDGRGGRRYRLEGCKPSGCVMASNEVSLTAADFLQTIGYLKSSNTGAGDAFGQSVAISDNGEVIAVSAYLEESAATGINGNQADHSASSSGAVYVFARNGTTWAQEAYLKASNSEAGDFFGSSIALSGDGNTLAVGAFGEDSAALGVNGNQTDNTASSSGAVYIFTRKGTAWTQQAYLKASNTEAFDGFGRSMAIRENTLAVGAAGEDSAVVGVNGDQADNAASSSGAVYIFTRDGVTWAQQAYLKGSNTEAFDGFGHAVALSGNTLAVGASGEDSGAVGINGNQADNAASSSGAVYIFTRDGTTWTQQGYLKGSNTAAFDGFGHAVALSGNTLAVGASGEDSAAVGVNGAQADNAASSSGAVYLFTRGGATWTQQAYLKASNTEELDQFGRAVALSAEGTFLAVGATNEASGAIGANGNQEDNTASSSGAVYAFARDGATWTQQAYLKAPNTRAGDLFGSSLAVDKNGDALVVGAVGESGGAIGVGGNQADRTAQASGAAYLY